jgi:hypothetical protein
VIPQQPKLMRAALAAADRGWHVFPLRTGDKRPAIRDWQVRATTDRDRIVRCWSAGPYNVGVACGPSGLVVLDLDTAKPGEPVPAPWSGTEVRDGRAVLQTLAEGLRETVPDGTFTVRTRSGGTHLYFATPDGEPLRNTAGRLGWLIDSRADGGYVVAAGSVVALRGYRLVDDRPVAALPAWIETRLRQPAAQDQPALTGPALTAVRNTSSYATTALRAELAHLLAAEPGTRNHTLNAAAYALGQLVAAGALEGDATANALSNAGKVIGLAEREIEATVRSGLAAGSRHPRPLTPRSEPAPPAAISRGPRPERQVQP